MMRAMLLIPLFLLPACDPGGMADKAVARAAESVITPIIDDGLSAVQAEGVTRCIVEHAQPGELKLLARDIGTVAGTSTVATVMAVAARPQTVACLLGAGQPQVRG